MSYPPIPYGRANFRRIRLDGCLYVDKTRFIRDLEQERYVFLIRPRRFGKTLWLTLLSAYYDRSQAKDFPAVFGGTDIGRQPTADRSRYVVLYFDFSAFKQTLPTLEEQFERHCLLHLRDALRRNRDLIDDGAARQSLSGTRGATARSNTGGVSNAQYQRARTNGTTFQTRQQAEQAFVSRNSSQYPSRYATQPSSRPSHIPQSTRVDGRNVNVTYNAGLGGYGYLHPTLGTWVLYSAMADAAMLGLLMSNQGYYYGPAPGAYYGGRPSGFWTGLMVIAIILAVFFVMRAGSRRH